MKQKEYKTRDTLMIYLPTALKEKIRDFAYSRKITISSLMLYATVKLMEEVENNRVGIFDLKMGIENELSPYYNTPRKIVPPIPGNSIQKEGVRK